MWSRLKENNFSRINRHQPSNLSKWAVRHSEIIFQKAEILTKFANQLRGTSPICRPENCLSIFMLGGLRWKNARPSGIHKSGLEYLSFLKLLQVQSLGWLIWFSWCGSIMSNRRRVFGQAVQSCLSASLALRPIHSAFSKIWFISCSWLAK